MHQGSARTAFTLLLGAAAAAQATWTEAFPAASPPARSLHAMAYDAARGQVVLFGGLTWAGNDGETWIWDGSTWTQKQPATKPSPRIDPALCYDAFRERVVLFGGVDTRGWTNETWEWDGSQWTLRTIPGPAPSRRCCLAYDSKRRRTVLHFLDQTWEYDGSQWTRRTPATTPPARDLTALAYDAARGRVVLYGGNGLSVIFGDTWEWDGVTWTQVAPTASPPPRQWHAMAYDAQRGQVVVFGGIGTMSVTTETWVWNGAAWAQQAGAAPPGRSQFALAYDAARDEAILFGGDRGGGMPLGDTWRKAKTAVTPPAWAVLGTGCAGSAGTPSLAPAFAGLPWLGEELVLQARGLPSSTSALAAGVLGASSTQWGSVPLPLDLGSLGMPGCQLRVSPDLVASLANLGGHADWRLPIPAAPALVGRSFFAQALSADPAANLLGIVVSNAGRATVAAQP